MTSTQPGELRVVARQLLTTTLGDDLLALYASGAEDGAGRLWLAIRPDTPPQRVREIFYPFWRRHRSLLTIGPLLGTPDDVRRYAKVLPQEVAAFRVDAELLDGDDLLVQALRVARADPLHSLAWVADETLVGSAIVASPDEDWRQTTGSTLRLSQRLSRAAGRAGIAPSQSPSETLARLHAYLATVSERHPAYRWKGRPPGERPPAHLPGLLALLGWGERLVVVLPELDQATLATIDWHRVAELVAGEFETLLVATPWQIRLVASVAEAVSFTFRSFELIWGADILAGCRPSDDNVRLSAAMLPARTLVERLPAEYLTADESDLGALIHAVQNVLQNIQMRSELWARIREVAPRRPPEPLPGRETPPHQRVAALFRHLRWWTDRWAGPPTD